MSPEIKEWNLNWKAILTICIAGFLSGVGMLHEDFFFFFIALGLSILLFLYSLFAGMRSLFAFKALGIKRVLAIFLVGPAIWYCTYRMANEYPTNKALSEFHSSEQTYEAGVRYVKSLYPSFPEGQTVVVLTKVLRHLSTIGKAIVIKDVDGNIAIHFQRTYHLMDQICITYYDRDIMNSSEYYNIRMINNRWYVTRFDF